MHAATRLDQASLPPLMRRITPTLVLCLVGVLLPNALSLGSLFAGIGMPPRTTAIMAYAALPLVARLVPFGCTIALFLAIAAYDVVSTVALLFGLAPQEIVTALHLVSDLKILESTFYCALAACFAGLIAANLYILKRSRPLTEGGSALVLAAVALLFAGADLLANSSPHYDFGLMYASGRPMESAVESSGFRDVVLAKGERNVLLVVVEALGHFVDPARQDVLMAPFRSPALQERFTVSSGETTYFGATTAGEMRELCNTRESYETLLDGKSFDCLPQRFAARGYRTIAHHNFTDGFFDRRRWYPLLGFQEEIFGNDMGRTLQRGCGGPFRGVCDKDVVPVLARELTDAAKPTFAYWMTLSTHVPVALNDGTPRLGCEHGGGAIGHVEVCHMTELWLDLFEAVTALARDLPTTEILLVGDHAPPLWSRAGRALFTPGKVSWVRLSPKTGLRGSIASTDALRP